MIYGLGMLEMGITFDFGQLVMDDDFAGMIKHVVRGIRVDDGTLAVDLIGQVGSAGDFLSHEHTYLHMKEMSEPKSHRPAPPRRLAEPGRPGHVPARAGRGAAYSQDASAAAAS